METVYRTLRDFFTSIGLPLQQDFEMTVHRLKGLHGEGKKQSPPFRTNYYAFLLITAGKSHYTIDQQEFALGNGSFYFTNPGHLKSFRIEVPLEGFMLTFSDTFVKENFSVDLFQRFPFLVHESTPVMQLGEEQQTDLTALFEMLLAEYQGGSTYKKAILTNHLMVLLYKTKDLLTSHHALPSVTTRSSEIVTAFKSALDERVKTLVTGKTRRLISVKDIAQKLALHPNHLSSVVKAQTGKPATAWIQERLLTESQSLLKNTTQTVSEIAYRLGFTDSTHFTKFYKKMTGILPAAYRKNATL
jgi:AraC family transcriptional regulator, transcriptional activator of pobA